MSCPNEADLLLYAEGLDDRSAGHVRDCDRCRATVEELKGSIGLLRASVPPETDHVAGRLTRLATPPQPSSAPRWIALGTAAAAIIVVAIAIFAPPRPAVPGPAPASPQDESGKTPSEGEEIAALILKLGSESPEEREEAQRALEKMGRKAIPYLEKEVDNEDSEIRARSRKILKSLNLLLINERLFEGRSLKEKPVQEALTWLMNNQQTPGSWGSVGLTGLALLAYLGAGQGESSKEYGPTVTAAIDGLISRQAKDGCVGERTPKYMYDHAIATWALVEASVVGTPSIERARSVRETAEKAVAFLVSARNPGKGWRYMSQCGDNDSSVTFWAGSALAIAKRLGFSVPAETFDGARTWYNEATDDSGYFLVGYNRRGTGKVYVKGVNESFDYHQTMSAAAAAFRVLAGDAIGEPEKGALAVCLADLPSTEGTKIDYYYWHIATLTIFQIDGPEGKVWKKWSSALVEALGKTREKDGSWKTAERWAPVVAEDTVNPKVYTTAINALTLETATRYPVLRK